MTEANQRVNEMMRLAGIPSEMEQTTEVILRYCFDYCEDNLSSAVSGALRSYFGFEDSSLHTCPFSEAVHGDYDKLCDCDEEATLGCAYEI